LILVVWVPFAFRANIQRLQSLAAEIQATPDDIQFLRRHGSQRAACESLSLCFWSDAPFNIDFFNLGQKLKTGRVPMDACSVLFDGAHFSVIQMYTLPTTVDSRLPVACNRAMIEHYDVARVSINGVFLLPRPQPHAASMSPAFTS